jgi:Asp/Glu/hydantoin racemase
MSEIASAKKPRIAFVHTEAGLVGMFAELAARELPEAEVFHILNESLLQDLLRSGATPAITRRIVEQAVLAADADADLVVFTCSSTSPAMAAARQLVDVPIIKIDDPMAHDAALIGGHIGILCTTNSTMAPSRALVDAHATTLGRTVQVEVKLVEGAFDALRAGRRNEHDDLVQQAALELADNVDILVLAQASLAHLREPLAGRLTIPVLASPPLLIADLRRRLKELAQ